jgi:hypothetical protein
LKKLVRRALSKSPSLKCIRPWHFFVSRIWPVTWECILECRSHIRCATGLHFWQIDTAIWHSCNTASSICKALLYFIRAIFCSPRPSS